MEMIKDSDSCVIIKHNGQTLTWNTSVLASTKFSDNTHPFKEVNGFLSTLSSFAQDHIFGIYEKILNKIHQFSDTNDVNFYLINCFTELYQQIPMTLVDNWIHYNGNIRYRKDLKERHDADDNHPERTYLKSDYRDLVTLAVLLRFAIPIWGEYLNQVKGIKSPQANLMKEYFTMRLLKDTELINSRAMVRLQNYIAAFIEREETKMDSAIILAISSADKVEYIAANTIVRRIAVGVLNADDTTGCLISNIHEHIKWMVQGSEVKFGIYRDRYQTTGDKENELSLLEQSRAVSFLPTGEKRTMAVFVQDIYHTCRKIDPTISRDLVKDCIAANKDMDLLEILEHHTLLAQWTLGTVIAHQEIPSMRGKERIAVHIATQALAIHWGFPILGLLATAIKRTFDYGMNSIGDTRDQVSRNTVTELFKVYPYYNHNSKEGIRQANPVYIAITEIAKQVRSEIWQCAIPSSIQDVVKSDIDNNGRLIVPPGIAEMIALFVIKIANNTKEQYQREKDNRDKLQSSLAS